MIDNTPDVDARSADERVVREAKRRFRRCEEWERDARENFLYDMRFANGDSINNYQWDDAIHLERSSARKPCLTMNKTKQHCRQVINDQLQHKAQIRINPVGGDASYEAAQVLEGIVRHIEYISNAQDAYGSACYSQVIGGIGYWRIITDYASATTFDQEIYIRRVADPLTVYLDPDISEADGSDAKFAFVYSDMPREDFQREYPDEDITHETPLSYESSDDDGGWERKDTIRVCEYFRKVFRKDVLHLLPPIPELNFPGGEVLESEVRAEHKRRKKAGEYGEDDETMLDTLLKTSVASRPVELPMIEWYFIAGSKVIDQKPWVGKYIPIVRVVGEEIVLDHKLDRKGHTRALIDPQRMYNYTSSSFVEHVALQTKTPYLVNIQAITGFEQNWAKANVDNAAYLPYNATDEMGNPIEPPQRIQPPAASQAYVEGLKISMNDMMMVSNQYEANMGAKSNEVSGTAVDARQRQGETATYHYIDRLSQAIRYTGRVLVDLIPKIYDTPRVVKILAENGDESTVQIDPSHPVAHQPLQNPDAPDFKPDAIQAIFNPTIGEYDVEADVGPSFATRREETFNAIVQMIKTDPQILPVVGDLLFRAADFPMADQIAQRLKNMVPQQALTGQAQPNPQVQQMQELLQKQHQDVQNMSQQIAEMQIKAKDQQQKYEIDMYKAQSERFKVMSDADKAAMMPVVREMVSQLLGAPVNPVIAAHAQENAAMAQPPPEPTQPQQAPQDPSQ